MTEKKKETKDETQKRIAKENEKLMGENKTRLPDHTIAETHLKDLHTAPPKPGGDGDENTPKGTSQAGSIVAGAQGQAVGLPKPMEGKAARDAGFGVGKDAGKGKNDGSAEVEEEHSEEGAGS